MNTTKILALVCALMLLCGSVASACTAIYVGSDLTEDGTTLIARSEDFYVNDYNKLFYVSPAGNHTAGEEYVGCYGFTYTFSHDSYSYTARRDDNSAGVCPDCGSTHDHTPYEEAGTNEMGVMVSATESLYGNEAVAAVDPFTDAGIEEAEITTVLLSEAATAREGVDLLLSIYDSVGANAGSGVFIADQNETWFVENMSGHSYIAVKLTSSVVFMQPNISALGKIDLDDTENVIASENVISVAQEAGTFVGDAEANVIDFNASYNSEAISSRSARLSAGLNYLYGDDRFATADYTEEDYVMSNIDDNGEIVPLYSNIVLSKPFTVDDVINFYKVEPIGYTANEEIHIFQVNAQGDADTAVVEWGTMDDGRYNAFVPYYPMLTTDTAACYKVSVGDTEMVADEPTEGDWYSTEDGYVVYPQGWKDSYYWALDSVSNLMSFGEASDEDKAAVQAAYAALQQEIYDDFAAMQEAVANAQDLEAKQSAATNGSMNMAEKVQHKAIELYETYSAK